VFDTRREADREVTCAGTELKHTARVWSEQRLNDGKSLCWIWRPVLVRRRDLLVTELVGVLGREMLWFGPMWLSHALSIVTTGA
jgi:hypothetical protein